MKEIEVLSKWRNIPCSCLGTLSIVKILVLPNLIKRFNTTPNKISAILLKDIEKAVLKFLWKSRVTRRTKIILKHRTKLESLHYLASKFTVKSINTVGIDKGEKKKSSNNQISVKYKRESRNRSTNT